MAHNPLHLAEVRHKGFQLTAWFNLEISRTRLRSLGREIKNLRPPVGPNTKLRRTHLVIQLGVVVVLCAHKRYIG